MRGWMLALVAAGAGCAQTVERDGLDWVATHTGVASTSGMSRLRVEARGLVVVRGGDGNQISYRVRNRVRAVSQDDARRVFELVRPQVRGSGGTVVVAVPIRDLPVVTELEVRVPTGVRLAEVANELGDVILRDLPADVDVLTGAGRVDADHLAGRLSARTGGGEIRLGHIGGTVRAMTGAGAIQARHVGANSRLETRAGEIFIDQAAADVYASTGAGNVQVIRAGGSVDAYTVGGLIRVMEAGGTVTADNGGGITRVGSARGVRCESTRGAIRLAGVTGELMATTGLGNIFAELLAGHAILNSILETGGGDITVTIPSNLSVTVRAISESGRMGSIVTEFPEIRLQRSGSGGHAVATGALNGGGPVLKVAAARGVVYLRRAR